MEKKKVHLVLGSGGARGLAHIGIIEVLEEKGYEIASVVGCSMGAIVGGMYAAGYLRGFKEWMLGLTKVIVFNIMDFTLTRQGFLKGERVFRIMQKAIGNHMIENLKIPFTAVATDLLHRREVHYSKGDLYKGLRASIAIPGVFIPVLENNQFLLDGAVLNPLPVNLVTKKEDEIVIAVDVNGPPALSVKNVSTDEYTEAVAALWNRLKSITDDNRNQKHYLPIADYSLTELLDSSYQATQFRLTEQMVKAYPPDLLVQIPINSCTTFEFYRAKEMIELGRIACLNSLPE